MGKSPLLALDIDMVNTFPIDYMHNVCLGVMRKLLNCWVGGKLTVRLASQTVKLLSNRLLSFREYMPREINRKPRSLDELPRFKATEFRSFLLYTGVIALHNLVDVAVYNHFLLFHCGIALLVSPKSVHNVINYEFANHLLKTFVEHSENLYGPEFLIYNVHVLSHLCDDALHYGLLDSFSAFPFENFLNQLKRLLKSPTKPLEQIVKRLHEINSIALNNTTVNCDIKHEQEHHLSPTLTNSFFR